MTKVFLFLLTIVSTITLGQETEKVTEEHQNPKYKEVFYVLKSDKTTKQGNCQQLGFKNALFINGYFVNGLKDSVWTGYKLDGKTKPSEGKYSKNSRVGMWEFYDFKGELEQKYDFSKTKLFSLKTKTRTRNLK